MKARTLILGVLLIALIACAAFSPNDSPQNTAIRINNHELNRLNSRIGSTVIIKYNTRYLNECIADMESRGYVVKQVEEKSGVVRNNITVVVYERRK